MENAKDMWLKRMQTLLGEDISLLEHSLTLSPTVGLRVNTLLIKPKKLFSLLPFSAEPLSFCSDGFALPSPYSGVGRLPLHHAGAFYMQEPSAMAPVCVLDVKPHERVLDLCAAPGGKSTQIAAHLKGSGLLVCNEVVHRRALQLLSNLERLGVRSAAVYCKHPKELARQFPNYFDKVLVDAPCSGEGMFRKNPAALADWSPKHVTSCAARQREILKSAAQCLRPGGVMVYSTCTFSPEENEWQVLDFLQQHPDFTLEKINLPFGSPSRPEWADGEKSLTKMWRVFPFEGGEGQFIAKLRKQGDDRPQLPVFDAFVRVPEFEAFWRETFLEPFPLVAQFGNRLYILPSDLPKAAGALRAGVLAGELQNGRFLPAHHLFSCAYPISPAHRLSFSSFDSALGAFLRGMEIPCSQTGYLRVEVDGVPVGFGKGVHGRLKNHYPKGLRER